MDMLLNAEPLSISKASFEAAHSVHTGWSRPFCGFQLINSSPWTNQNSFSPRPSHLLTCVGPASEAKNANGRALYFIIKFAPLTCRCAGLTLARSLACPRVCFYRVSSLLTSPPGSGHCPFSRTHPLRIF